VGINQSDGRDHAQNGCLFGSILVGRINVFFFLKGFISNFSAFVGFLLSSVPILVFSLFFFFFFFFLVFVLFHF